MTNHNLCFAKVFHKRFWPRQNQFLYQVYYLLINLDEIEKIKSKFLSLNKFNIFSFYNKDHAKHNQIKGSNNLRNWINNILKAENIEAKKVMLLCHPRIFGYVFNPASFWFCFDEKDRLIAVLSEVQNTFGEAHSYLIYNQNLEEILPSQEHFAKKEFHVSPFFKREGKYRFKFDYSREKIKVFIDYFDEDKLLLQTYLVAVSKPINDYELTKAFFAIPFVTLKVIILIHYQALKIVFKGIKYVKKPSQLSNRITKFFK